MTPSKNPVHGGSHPILIAMLLALEGMNVDTNYRRLMKITFGVFEMPIAEERNDPVKY